MSVWQSHFMWELLLLYSGIKTRKSRVHCGCYINTVHCGPLKCILLTPYFGHKTRKATAYRGCHHAIFWPIVLDSV